MSLFVTPGQFIQRAQLYQQLGQLTAAGISIPQALELQHRSPPSRSFRQPLSVVIGRLAEGATFHEALVDTGSWLPAFDAALIHAGEQSGRLPVCFNLLAAHYEQNAALLRKTYSGLIYPALLFHMAVLIGPLPALFGSWNFLAYLAKTLGVFIPVYVVTGFVVFAMQGRHGERWSGVVESVIDRVPLLGKARRNLALARLASALEALIAAGVSIIEAWEFAGAASGSPALRRAIGAWKPQLLSGATPAELVRGSGVFPNLFANLYHTGEVTGSLDDALRRLRVLHQSEGEHQLRMLAEWTPRLIYFGVVIMVAWQVIRFWTGYFDQINRVISF